MEQNSELNFRKQPVIDKFPKESDTVRKEFKLIALILKWEWDFLLEIIKHFHIAIEINILFIFSKAYPLLHAKWFGFFVFKDIPTFVGYLMPKPFYLKNSSGSI